MSCWNKHWVCVDQFSCSLYCIIVSPKVFHEMVNSGVEPNDHTYGALIDGCARAGQVAKAFGAYGIMRSKV